MTKKFFGVQSMLTGSLLHSSTETATSSPPSDGKPMNGDSKNAGLDDLIDDIESWWQRMDKAFNKAMRMREEKITCDTCPHIDPGCCHQKVLITIFEMLPIVRYLLRQGRDTPEFRAQLEADGIMMEGMGRTEFFHGGGKCTFLQSGRCSIYAVRPSACRSYHVVSEPERCQPGRYDGIRKINDEAYVNETLLASRMLNKELGLKETAKRIMMGALPRMVLMGLEMWEAADFQGFVRAQPWPTDDNLDDWIDKGKNPYAERLYQIRSKKDGLDRPGQ
ncbi:MAG: YkgJ family cysteine cluster protein [Salinibacterium sp.]|nr:MAG: YkgJ family cysteine cluster protein [Salinibacterium sp.]